MKGSPANAHSSEPSPNTWRELYTSALEFKELAPWNWMPDSVLFGFQNPEDGEIGYCCVLGAGGDFSGLAVYLGTEGLIGYLAVQAGMMSNETDPLEILHSKKCLVASFESKRYLSRRDLQVIQELGLRCKGQNAYPQFRMYEPHYYPWYVNEEQAVFLTLCLKQTGDVALRFKDNPDMLTAPRKNLYFVRVPQREGNSIMWTDSWLKPAPLKTMVYATIELDESRLKRIETCASRAKMVWEIDSFYAPTFVQNKHERPYYPQTFICVDKASDFVLNVHVASESRYEEEFIEYFLRVIEDHKLLPAEINVKKNELYMYVKPFAERLEIGLKLVKRLTAVERAKKSMLRYFKKF